jgi:hypothetical protein
MSDTRRRAALAVLGLLAFGGTSAAGPDRFALPAGLQEKVNRAVERGSAWMKKQLADFHAGRKDEVAEPATPMDAPTWKRFEEGVVALMGLALLESDVPADDPAVQKTAAYLRQRAPALSQTYSLAVAVFFFDRLGDARDRPLIRALALRLVLGQSGQGLWGYACPPLTARGDEQLLRFLESTRALDPEAPEVTRALPPMTFAGPRLIRGAGLNGRYFRHLAAVQGLTGPLTQTDAVLLAADRDDLSNTQFAVLALWVARRHGLPLGPVLTLAARAYRKAQQPSGAWEYASLHVAYNATSTCSGLLALAVERGLQERPKKAEDDDALQKGFRSLSGTVGVSYPASDEAGAIIHQPDAWGDLYYFWSLERVAMAYDLEVVGGKKWYPWAAEKIVAAQQADGRWKDAFGGVVDTSFALLVLKRANLVKDLTSKISGSVVFPVVPDKIDPPHEAVRPPAETVGPTDPRVPEKPEARHDSDRPKGEAIGPTVPPLTGKPAFHEDSRSPPEAVRPVEEGPPGTVRPPAEDVPGAGEENKPHRRLSPSALLAILGGAAAVAVVALLLARRRGGRAAPPASRPAPVEAAAGKVAMRCDACGRGVQVSAALADRKLRCPWCGGPRTLRAE